jgi:(1->4)-alpha-D-glucan 1-alpha-D-glucosylmutase
VERPLVANVTTPIPVSTYRVQFGPHFRFSDGEAIVPYLDALGVGWLYASPYFRARPGSEHGYDVVDHNHLNPEIGSEADHRAMVGALRTRGMGHLVDFVPNHMGIGADNPWWRDVLALGRLSAYAHFFDIDWHARSTGRGKVVLPFLGDHYGAVLERGELTVAFDRTDGAFVLRYFEHRFPLAPSTYALVLERAAAGAPADAAVALRERASAFAALRGRPREGRKRSALRERIAGAQLELAATIAGDTALARAVDEACAAYADDPDRLDALVRAQHYRPAYWRTAADEINYRRFFDINDLAGLRVEDAEVLARTHQLVFAMIADGRVGGLRIDHVDGLANPGGYVNLLVERAQALGNPLYVVIEKILLGDERLRSGWLAAGTTGYDFMNLVLGLFVDAAAERGFDRIYRRATGRSATFAEEAEAAKRRILRIDLASELFVLADALARIAAGDRRSSDFTTLGLRRALADTIVAFPVYRTYVVDERVEDDDRRVIESAVAQAVARSENPDPALYDFIGAAVDGRLVKTPGARYDRVDVLRFAMRFQQYTGPVMAKSLEDTAFYRYVRLAALNEVGGEPARFGRSVAEFHAANAERARTHPHAMLATATHDHKRGEDTRLRIAALTEFPAEWSRAIARWSRMNAGLRDAGRGAPSPVDELLFYQTVVGTLPLDAGPHADYAERLAAYAAKAAREAKLHTSWTDPNATYEAALEAFVRGALAPDTPFFRDASAFVAQLAPTAAVHGLAQVALKLTAPGVPDIYQGCELWDFSLVDPDNRRPVDYERRGALLADFRTRADGEALCAELLAAWPDGRIKLFVTWKLLQLRRERAATFASGAYRALRVDAPGADGVVAFARDDVVVAAPRLVRARLQPGGIALNGEPGSLMTGLPGGRFRSALDGRELHADAAGAIPLAQAFAILPVAVLTAAGVPGERAGAGNV